MANSRSLQQAVRFALATAATAAAGITALHAQEATAPAAAAAPVEEVVVTGSRLTTPNETSISPITTISATDVQQTGLTRVEDVLNNMPMVFAGMNATTANGADGTASVDLRGLGNQRTLVLVNGLRLGPGSPIGGRNYSDINEIPATLIERVDILTGGASAVYGADAVAGVVNFILNTHFEGIRVDAGYNFYQHNNNDQSGVASLVSAVGDPLPSSSVNTGFGKFGSFLIGSNFADNKGNATAYVTYNNQGSALQSSFDYSACSLGATGGKLGCAGSGTSAKNGAGGEFLAFGNNGTGILDHTVDGKTGQFRPFAATDLYNFGPLNYYLNPNERWTAGAFVNYDVNEHVNVYTQIMFMRNNVQAQIAASGDFGYSSFTPCANPLFTGQERSVICSQANLAAQGNPYETFQGVNYPGVNMYILRRNVEGGNRILDATTNSNRQVIGVKGDFGDNVWTYDVYGQHSSVNQADANLNYTGLYQMQQALNVLPVGTNGAAVCGGPTSNAGGFLVPSSSGFFVNPKCVPWNIWNAHGVNQNQLAFLDVPLTDQGVVTEYVANASVTGDLGKYGVKLPTADQGLQANFGTEYREDTTQFVPDYITQQGLGGGVGGPTPPISGGFHVWEVFTEMRLPLATHQFLADDFSVEAGYRYSKYSEGFSTDTYKVGLDWAPIHDVRLRGSYQRAVRAPNIGELYTPQSVGLDGSIDPCAGPTPTATQAQCALTGVRPGQYGHIIANSANQYNGLLGGNPNLKPETADTYTFGVVLQPSFVPNLTLSADYYNISIKNVIGLIGANTIINDCIATGQSQFCDLIHRAGNGSLWLSQQGFVTDTTVNQGELRTKGVDVKGSYRYAINQFGSLLFSLEGTYLQSLQTTPVPGFGSYDCVGFFGSTCGGANPHWRHVFNLTWSTPWDGLDLNLRWRYIGAGKSEQLSSSTFLAGSPYLPLSHIPAYNYIDLTGTFNLYKGVRLMLGVNNIADKNPPLVVGGDCSTSSPAGANCNGNTFPGVYDALGRYLFATLTAQF